MPKPFDVYIYEDEDGIHQTIILLPEDEENLAYGHANQEFFMGPDSPKKVAGYSRYVGNLEEDLTTLCIELAKL